MSISGWSMGLMRIRSAMVRAQALVDGGGGRGHGGILALRGLCWYGV